MTLRVPVCGACGWATFPALLLCPRCGAASWGEEVVGGGVLEGRTERDGVGIGAVRTPLGPVVVARLEGRSDVGDRVELDERDGIPVAS